MIVVLGMVYLEFWAQIQNTWRRMFIHMNVLTVRFWAICKVGEFNQLMVQNSKVILHEKSEFNQSTYKALVQSIFIYHFQP
jgi:hypothetical protein